MPYTLPPWKGLLHSLRTAHTASTCQHALVTRCGLANNPRKLVSTIDVRANETCGVPVFLEHSHALTGQNPLVALGTLARKQLEKVCLAVRLAFVLKARVFSERCTAVAAHKACFVPLCVKGGHRCTCTNNSNPHQTSIPVLGRQSRTRSLSVPVSGLPHPLHFSQNS